MQRNTILSNLIGTWTLESFALASGNGPEIFPMGNNPTGYVAYGSDGWMSFLVAAADRPSYDVPAPDGGTEAQTVAAARGFMAYGGPYSVNESESTVSQSVAHCLIPNWIGDVHKRDVAILDDVLTLTSDPFPLGHATYRIVLRFARQAAQAR